MWLFNDSSMFVEWWWDLGVGRFGGQVPFRFVRELADQGVRCGGGVPGSQSLEIGILRIVMTENQAVVSWLTKSY